MLDWFLPLLGVGIGLALVVAVMWLALKTEALGWGTSWFSRPSRCEDTGISVGTPNGQIED